MARLRHRFSPRKIRLGASGNTPLGGGNGESTLFLVGRELCLFHSLDAGKVPIKQRNAFAALAVRRIAPFPDPEFDAAWGSDGTAAIWYWSRSRTDGLAASEPGRRKRFVAEARYAGAPMERGTELLRYPEGLEARAWKNGKVIASRWWRDSPSASDWREFCRGASLGGDGMGPVPEASDVILAAAPWSREGTSGAALQLSGLDQYLPKAALIVASLFLLALGAELGFIARAQVDIWRSGLAATRLDAPLKRILDARDATDQHGAQIASLLALRSLRPTTSLMAEVARLVPGNNWQIRKWSQPTQDAVEISLIAPGSNPEQLVSALEASPMLKNVAAELGDANELVIKATITDAAGLSGQATR